MIDVIETSLSDAESRGIAGRVREELARRRSSRRRLASDAKISLSSLEAALAGRRPFTLAATIRLEEALGVPLRPTGGQNELPATAPARFGGYARQAAAFLEGDYLTLRPSFGQENAIFAFRTEIRWDAGASCLLFRESERLDSAYTQDGAVSMPQDSAHLYLVTNRAGQYRLVTLSRPTRTGEMYGILMTLRAGAGSQLTPIAAPIALVPLANMANVRFGRIVESDPSHDLYRKYLVRVIEEGFAVFLPHGSGHR